MTSRELDRINLKNLILKMLREHPEMMHRCIAELLGCHRESVTRIAGIERKYREQVLAQTSCAVLP